MSETPPEVSSGVESKYGILSRTWELELLVSGAVFFSLLQVPGLIDQIYSHIDIHLTSETYVVAFLGHVYGKAIMYVLIGAFLTHLTSRAYWVGLVGLDSVFPNGVKWDKKSRFGPIGRELLRDNLPTLPRTIAALDNFCSVIFGFAFSVVFFFLYTASLAITAGLLVFIIGKFIPGISPQKAFFPILLVLAFYPAILITADKRLGFRPGSRAHRVLRRLMQFSIIRVLSVIGAGVLTLTSNVPKRVIRPLGFGVLVGSILLVFATAYIQRTGVSSLGQWFVPSEQAASAVDYQFYEDRATDADPRVPRIQSDVITQPYVRLLIPYYAQRDNNAIARGCPGLDPKQLDSDEGSDPNPSAVDTVLQCVAKLRDINLDDAPVPGTELHLYRDPRTGFNGFVTYVPTAAMTHGRHVLTVKQMPRDEDDPKSPPPPYRIWFWI
jgi:hypothetical protein